MKELIKINDWNNQKLVNARELHEFLESKKDFTSWIKIRIEKYHFEKDKDYVLLTKFGEQKTEGRGGHNKTEYGLTLDMAKELAMVENNEKGRQIRKYFIEVENIARQNAGKPIDPSKLTRLEILKMAIESEQQRVLLEAEVKIMQSKVDALDQITGCREVMDIGQAAKILELGFGRNTLFKELRNRNIFFKNRNEPKQQYIDRDYFRVREVQVTTPKGLLMKMKVYVTQKGIVWLHKVFNTKQQVLFSIN